MSKKSQLKNLNQASTLEAMSKNDNDELNDDFDGDDDDEEDYLDESEPQSDEIDDQTYNLAGN